MGYPILGSALHRLRVSRHIFGTIHRLVAAACALYVLCWRKEWACCYVAGISFLFSSHLSRPHEIITLSGGSEDRAQLGQDITEESRLAELGVASKLNHLITSGHQGY
jgi:hypothetical protein